MPRILPPRESELSTFTGLRQIVAELRGRDGCPWDRVQTHHSLRPYLSEETAEVLAAIDDGDTENMKEELGDLLFQVLIHVQLAEEDGAFSMGDVIQGIAAKLIRRHPHVFGDSTADTPDQVVAQWDDLKAAERTSTGALDGIPVTLPSLAYAQAIQRRAVRAGFAWENEDQAWAAFDEEVLEARSATSARDRANELGDALFALVGLCREYETDAEDTLRSACRRFMERFNRMEAAARELSMDMKSTSIEDKIALWREVRPLTGGST